MFLPTRFHQNCQAAFGRCEHLWVKHTVQVHTSAQVDLLQVCVVDWLLSKISLTDLP